MRRVGARPSGGADVEVGLIYLMLCFPSGRLTDCIDRALVAAVVLPVALLFLPTALLVEQYPVPGDWVTCDPGCPPNAFMIADDEPRFLEQLVIPLRELLGVVLFLAVIVRLAQRIHRATTLLRVTLAPCSPSRSRGRS